MNSTGAVTVPLYARLRPDYREQYRGFATPADTVIQILRMRIYSGCATSGPPIGPVLGQYAIPISKFCTEFNERCEDLFNDDVEVYVTLYHYQDGSYSFDTYAPVTTACGLRAGAGVRHRRRRIKGRRRLRSLMTPYMAYEAVLYKFSHDPEYNKRVSMFSMHALFMHYRDTMKSMCIKVIRGLGASRWNSRGYAKSRIAT